MEKKVPKMHFVQIFLNSDHFFGEKKFFWRGVLNLYQAISGVFSFWLGGGVGGGGGPKFKVAQNVLTHILVLEYLKSNEIFKSIKCSNWSQARK